MTVRVACANPECRTTYRVSRAYLGRTARCQKCGRPFVVTSSPGGVEADDPDGVPMAEEPTVGAIFAERYRVEGRLGAGGMGAVFRAVDEKLGRAVALKVPHFRADEDQALLLRFDREARIAAGFDHPNLCPVFDVGESNGARYLTMPLIGGTPLSELVADGPLDADRAVAIVRTLAAALAEAHDRGVIHRDLKPANVLICPRRGPVVVDFGLARRDGPDEARLTRSRAVLGTPAYMAPEQVDGDQSAVGPAADIYALGVILYELLTGARPFKGSVASLLVQIKIAEPAPPSSQRPGLDPRLDAACLRALAKDPAERFGSMAELAAALDREPHPEPNAPSSPLAIAFDEPHQSIADGRPRRRSPGRTRGPASWIAAGVGACLVPAIAWVALRDRATGRSESTGPPSVDRNDATVEPVAPPSFAGDRAGRERSDNGLGLVFCWCPAGTFLMGSPVNEPGRDGFCEGQVRVTLTRGFWLGKFEVTQEQYQAVMTANPSYFAKSGAGMAWVSGRDTARFPVESVSWDDVAEFCRRFTDRERRADRLPEGWEYRLPTEAQWEYACRAGTTTATAFGDRLSGRQAAFEATMPYNTTEEDRYLVRPREVGQFGPNRWGLHDLHGNVEEWCRDWFLTELPGGTDPMGNTVRYMRVCRGGSWKDRGADCRSAARTRISQDVTSYEVGFRVALVPVD